MKFRMRHLWNGTFHTLEIIIILLLIVGGIGLFWADPITTGGPVTRLIGSQYAAYFYATVFIIEGVLLGVAKFWRKKKLHKFTLFTVYVTMLFTIFLEMALTGGLTINVIDNIILSVFAGYCWLRWKFLTEYVDPNQFAHELDDLRDDLPPS